MGDPLLTALDAYRPGPVEQDVASRVRLLIGTGDPWSRERPLHVTASALVVDSTSGRILLRWHHKMRRWLQVGGHGNPGETDPWLVARREAQEETGLVDLTALSSVWEARPIQVTIVPVSAHTDEPAHEHADIRYVLKTARPDDVVPEATGAPLRWMTFAEAQAEMAEGNLLEFLRRVRDALE